MLPPRVLWIISEPFVTAHFLSFMTLFNQRRHLMDPTGTVDLSNPRGVIWFALARVSFGWVRVLFNFIFFSFFSFNLIIIDVSLCRLSVCGESAWQMAFLRFCFSICSLHRKILYILLFYFNFFFLVQLVTVSKIKKEIFIFKNCGC